MKHYWLIVIIMLSVLLISSSCAGAPETAPKPAPAAPIPSAKPGPSPETVPVATPEPPVPSAPEQPVEKPKEEPVPAAVSDEYKQTLTNHFGFMPAFFDYAAADEAGAQWTRPHFERFTWGWIEPEPGIFDFRETDRDVFEAQKYGFHILANVQPRAVWDEQQCYQGIPNSPPGIPPRFDGAHKPCNMDAYQNFVTTMVERYDGDGNKDMPGLTVPIKHWEIMNEPEFEMYFIGTPEDYVDIVKASYQAIKFADPEAVVVQGGMAGMAPGMTVFWQQVFDLQVADYFDVMNIHSIGHGEHLNIPAFKLFLEDNEITGKPIWVTEVQYQQAFETTNFTAEQFAETMARSYVFALANGVEKLLYVNLMLPQIPGGTPPGGGPPFDERSALIDDTGQKTPIYYAHHTIAWVLGDLTSDDTIEVIREEVGGWFITQGQYKFTIDGRIIYTLWGNGPIPPEIQGEVTITDIMGTSHTADASTIQLTDRPIFVQIP